jgi:osmotically-inducible protein OsmY
MRLGLHAGRILQGDSKMAYNDKGWDENRRRNRDRFGRDDWEGSRRNAERSGRDWMGSDDDEDYGMSERSRSMSGRDDFGRRSDWDENRQNRLQGMQDRPGQAERGGYGYGSGYGTGYGTTQRSQYGNRDRENMSFQQRQASGQYGTERSGYRYGSGSYGNEGGSRYYTGQQNSWTMPSPNQTAGYGYGGYGDDYREHGYRSGSSSDDQSRGFIARAGDEIASWFGDEEAARRREADHRGRGPKDYTRSDERIKEDANDRLTEDPRVDASHITVAVSNGELTLNGTVTSRDAKRRAEDCVEDISGVKHVQNNLRVQTQTTGTTTGTTGTSDNWATTPATGGQNATSSKSTPATPH